MLVAMALTWGCEHLEEWGSELRAGGCYGCPSGDEDVVHVVGHVYVICPLPTNYPRLVGRRPYELSIYSDTELKNLIYDIRGNDISMFLTNGTESQVLTVWMYGTVLEVSTDTLDVVILAKAEDLTYSLAATVQGLLHLKIGTIVCNTNVIHATGVVLEGATLILDKSLLSVSNLTMLNGTLVGDLIVVDTCRLHTSNLMGTSIEVRNYVVGDASSTVQAQKMGRFCNIDHAGQLLGNTLVLYSKINLSETSKVKSNRILLFGNVSLDGQLAGTTIHAKGDSPFGFFNIGKTGQLLSSALNMSNYDVVQFLTTDALRIDTLAISKVRLLESTTPLILGSATLDTEQATLHAPVDAVELYCRGMRHSFLEGLSVAGGDISHVTTFTCRNIRVKYVPSPVRRFLNVGVLDILTHVSEISEWDRCIGVIANTSATDSEIDECVTSLTTQQGTVRVDEKADLRLCQLSADVVLNFGAIHNEGCEEYDGPRILSVHNAYLTGQRAIQYTVNLRFSPHQDDCRNATQLAFLRLGSPIVIASFSVETGIMAVHVGSESPAFIHNLEASTGLLVDSGAHFRGLISVHAGPNILVRATVIDGYLLLNTTTAAQSTLGFLVAERMSSGTQTLNLSGSVLLNTESLYQIGFYAIADTIYLGSLTLLGPHATLRGINCCGGSNVHFGGCSTGIPRPQQAFSISNHPRRISIASGYPGDSCEMATGGSAGGSAYIQARKHLHLTGNIIANGIQGEMVIRPEGVYCGGAGSGGNIQIVAEVLHATSPIEIRASGGTCPKACRDEALTTGGASGGSVELRYRRLVGMNHPIIYTDDGECGEYGARSTVVQCPPLFDVVDAGLRCMPSWISCILIITIFSIGISAVSYAAFFFMPHCRRSRCRLETFSISDETLAALLMNN
ncbi:hypothetical protein GMRT_23280 [Giardia muris]|uniref:Uncharacterized protein n=1 Tax=Giardia muris TaxID=5742 RepID=A0A4Z1T5D8_GIAMU|nr:hypothetical protein GMRT_23280 [Giardia muris]|eukprot:TNJ27681.1 hypothetical protein GMRT_23280 [Giardia muris]